MPNPAFTTQDRAYNYIFRGGPTSRYRDEDPYELIDLVASMEMPVISIWNNHKFNIYCDSRELCTFTKLNRWGSCPMAVYKHHNSTLSEYWNIKELAKIYKGKVRRPNLEQALSQPIREMMVSLCDETLPYWQIGLLYGFPPKEIANSCRGPWHLPAGPTDTDSEYYSYSDTDTIPSDIDE